MRRMVLSFALMLVAALLGPTSEVSANNGYSPGARGVGDPYYPNYGNGGYDVQHYDLAIRYKPSTDYLWGAATIDAVATQGLSSFNLDFVGLTVRSITVDGAAADWSRTRHELTVDRPYLGPRAADLGAVLPTTLVPDVPAVLVGML